MAFDNNTALTFVENVESAPKYYLALDGIDDYLTVGNTITFDKVVMQFSVDATAQNTNLHIVDGRSGTNVDQSPISTAFSYVTKSDMKLYRNPGIPSMKVDGVTKDSQVLISNQIYNVEYGFKPQTNPALCFFVSNNKSSTTTTKGRLYRITGYNGATTVFDYDMSTGNVQDQSGNGNNATLTGGTWVEDGGTTPTTTNIEGTSSSASTTTATLRITKKLGGTSSASADVTGTVSVPGGMTGASSSASTTGGTLTRKATIVGPSSSSEASTATLRVTKKLNGASSASEGSTGTLRVTKPLEGSTLASEGTSGDVKRSAKIAGASSSTSAGSATILNAGGTSGSSVASSSASGSITKKATLIGPSSSNASTSGSLKRQSHIEGTSSVFATVGGYITRKTPITGISLATAQTSLESTNTGAKTIAGSSSSSSASSAKLSRIISIEGQTTASLSSIMGVKKIARLASDVAVYSQVLDAPLRTKRNLSSSEAVKATVSGYMATKVLMEAHIIVIPNAQGELTNRIARVISTIELKGSRQVTMRVTGRKRTTINLKGGN